MQIMKSFTRSPLWIITVLAIIGIVPLLLLPAFKRNLAGIDTLKIRLAENGENPSAAQDWRVEPRDSFVSKDPQLLRMFGLQELGLGLPEKSIPYLEKAYQLAPEDPFIQLSLGESYLVSGEVEKAITVWRSGNLSNYFRTRAQDCLLHSYDFVCARKYSELLTMVLPDDPNAFYLLGESINWNDPNAAIQAYETGLDLDQGQSIYKDYVASMSAYMQGDFPRAFQAVAAGYEKMKTVPSSPDAELIYRMGAWSAIATGKTTQIEDLKGVLPFPPNESVIRYIIQYYKENNLPELESYWQKQNSLLTQPAVLP